MGFYEDIGNNFGIGVVQDLKLWANLNNRMARTNCRRNFLLRCRSHGVTPRHIRQNIKCINNLVGENAEDNRKALALNNQVTSKLLNLEISMTIKKINSLHVGVGNISNKVESILPEHILTKFKQTQSKSYDKAFTSCTSNLKTKFDSLWKNATDAVVTKESWFSNFTDYVFPNDIAQLLRLGPKFAHSVPAKRLSIKTILADSEALVKFTSDETQDLLRAKATNAITNFFHNSWNQENPLYKTFLKTTVFLKEHRDIVVTMADKGNVTVAIPMVTYEEKMSDIINDESVYKKLSSDPTSRFQTMNNSLVKVLKDKKYIDGVTAKKLNNYKGVPPTIYGLPKIHKEGMPLRPIVSTIHSPTTELSKFIAGILQSAFNDGYHTYAVKDPYWFAERVNNLQLPLDFVVISLDAISLFTNISWELTVEIIMSEWERIQSVTSIPQELFIKILKFLFDSNYFKYKDEYYSQTFGCPMGSNLSPILAAIVITALLRTCVNQLSFQPGFLYQYVDDLILSIPHNGKDEILNVFNSFNEHIQFTIEEENDRSVPFLDTKVIRTDNNVIKLDWYRKPTSSGRYIHYKSNHDWQMKINVIKNLRNRIVRIAHPDYQRSSLQKLYGILRDNGYPHGLLKRLIFCTARSQNGSEDLNPLETIEQPPSPNNARDGNEENLESLVRFASLPSLPGLTSKLTHIFSSINNLKIAKYNVTTNRRLFTNLKDKVPVLSKSDCVYSISCLDCSRVYIGQTSQMLKKRITLHKSDIRLHPDRCALALHAAKNGHTFDFDNVKILSSESNYSKRIFLEMCHINEHQNTVNKRTDIKGLSNIYNYLLTLNRDSDISAQNLTL